MRNKVAESIFELQYIVAKWKSGKSGIFHKADDFDFLMSRGDPYYQFYKNAPTSMDTLNSKCTNTFPNLLHQLFYGSKRVEICSIYIYIYWNSESYLVSYLH